MVDHSRDTREPPQAPAPRTVLPTIGMARKAPGQPGECSCGKTADEHGGHDHDDAHDHDHDGRAAGPGCG